MKEQLVSFEIARLAKDKGFDYHSHHYIWSDGHSDFTITESVFENNGIHLMCKSIDYGSMHTQGYFKHGREYTISLPTQSLLQRWLRDEKNCIIIVDYEDVGSWYWRGSHWGASVDNYATYEQALEAGLQEALKLI